MSNNYVMVPRELLAGLVSNDRETRLDAERRMYGVLANQPAEAEGVERYDWTYDEMAESQGGNYVRHGDYDAVTAERVTLKPAPDLSVVAIRPTQTEHQPIGWITEDYLTDRSATTYDRGMAEKWRAKGWPVREIYAAPIAQTASQGTTSDQLRAEVERLRKDAARYQWLRGRLPGSAYRIAGVIYSEGSEGIDAAIEAAMATKEGV